MTSSQKNTMQLRMRINEMGACAFDLGGRGCHRRRIDCSSYGPGGPGAVAGDWLRRPGGFAGVFGFMGEP